MRTGYPSIKLEKDLEKANGEVLRLKKLNNQLIEKNRKLEARNKSYLNQVVGLRVIMGIVLVLAVVSAVL